ncbi:LysR family transcriptional regulator [Mycolicibacterium litorale]|uniref:Probable hydrogen peroxide-inducible genes activator n=1 Tax=Mycolicibacterium litorale TaxID=758802 RepID=A0A6S6P808_9MYCO|nr:LysR family transcriptional regulator [Mycolicibacterium litorale]BCI54774.1 LysR family transcriptional regulator [Mycolicibacterium litorale]
MELRQLEYFVAVADTLNFTRAASLTHVSQSPLSRQIKLLEMELGVTLFTRTSRSVTLTPAGRSLAEEARRVLAGTRQLKALADSAARGRLAPPLRVSAVATAFMSTVPDIIAGLRDTRPGIAVSVTCKDIADIEADLAASAIDVGFTRAFRPSPAFDSRVLKKEPLVAAVSSHGKWAHRAQLRVRDLADERLALVSREVAPEYVDTIIAVCRNSGFSPRIAFQGSDYLGQLGVASSGFAVAIVPAPLRDMKFPGVSFVDIVSPVLETALFLSQNRARPCPYFDEISDLATALPATRNPRSRSARARSAPVPQR